MSNYLLDYKATLNILCNFFSQIVKDFLTKIKKEIKKNLHLVFSASGISYKI